MLSSVPSLLAMSILLGLVYVLVAGALATASRGPAWNIGNRDRDPGPLPLHAARAHRAAANFIETFPFFAAAVVAALAMQRTGSQVELGAQLYFFARLAYLPIYIIGIPVVRSLVWGVALAGILLVVFALF